VRPAQAPRDTPRALRRRLDRLIGLPLRPDTVRFALERPDELAENSPTSTLGRLTAIDPGWTLLRLLRGRSTPALGWIAEQPWWHNETEVIDKLWRHAVAASGAARKLAHETGMADPDRVAGLGLVHALGLWAIGAESPELLNHLLAITDLPRRREAENRFIGIDAASLGRELAERWAAPSELAEAAWLHADLANDLKNCSADRDQLALVQKAYAWAERTPWALCPPSSTDPGPPDPRLRVLIAEVQVRCGTGFVAEDSSIHEERATRANASLQMRVSHLEAEVAVRDRFLDSFSSHSTSESLADWGDKIARVWCDQPGITAARFLNVDDLAPLEPTSTRPASRMLSLGNPSAPTGQLHLWLDPEFRTFELPPLVLRAWNAWASQLADRDRLARRLENSISTHREHIALDERQRPFALLEALAEFAAGAGHELNNPLAVILGRAQLLLTRAENPDVIRSLRAIVAQAQRAHRILRDLMYVARPPAPRARPCQPTEVLRACLRDLQSEADARGIRVQAELPESPSWALADPEPIRHLADVLIRNAMESTPAGGNIRVTAGGEENVLQWSIRDSGRGIELADAKRLFDPFYCGRQAGRGLGLGLPRASRIIERVGGDLSWRSSPGHGTAFQVSMPLTALAQATTGGGRPEPVAGERA
jgi:signal transduction histidine kinase